MILYALFSCAVLAGQPAPPCLPDEPPQLYQFVQECRQARDYWNRITQELRAVGSIKVCMKENVPVWQPTD